MCLVCGVFRVVVEAGARYVLYAMPSISYLIDLLLNEVLVRVPDYVVLKIVSSRH